MEISGIVLHLSTDPTSATEALRALRARGDLELGAEPSPGRIPGVLTAPPRASEGAIRSLEELTGVERVEVAFVAFEGVEQADSKQE